MSAARILLFTPYLNDNRGNSTTAKRIATGLRQYGCEVTIFAYEEEAWNDEWKEWAEQCHLFHIIHFYRFSKWVKQERFQITKPYIMTNGGTDVNLDLYNEVNRNEMLAFLKKAKVITVFTEDAKRKLHEAYRDLSLNVEVIGQSVWFPPFAENGSEFELPKGNPAILLPSGLRAVKDVFFLMEELVILQKKYPSLQFVISGTVLEEVIFKTLQAYMKKYDWIHFFENIPLEKMVLLYKWAHIVLNTSISEGQSSALLEAMELGCVVFARNNPGNASIILDGKTGFLFENGEEFLEKIEDALNHSDRVQSILTDAHEYVHANHGFENEINAYLKLYEDCL